MLSIIFLNSVSLVFAQESCGEPSIYTCKGLFNDPSICNNNFLGAPVKIAPKVVNCDLQLPIAKGYLVCSDDAQYNDVLKVKRMDCSVGGCAGKNWQDVTEAVDFSDLNPVTISEDTFTINVRNIDHTKTGPNFAYAVFFESNNECGLKATECKAAVSVTPDSVEKGRAVLFSVCGVTEGCDPYDNFCSESCLQGVDPKCTELYPEGCSLNQGDCCQAVANNGCDPDCRVSKGYSPDPDCTTCVETNDNCCYNPIKQDGSGDGVCDVNCGLSGGKPVDPDCAIISGYTSAANDGCNTDKGNSCDPDCPLYRKLDNSIRYRADPDCN